MRFLPTLLIVVAMVVRGSLPLAAQAAKPSPKLPDFDRRTPVVIAVENVGPAVVNIRAQSRVARPHFYAGLFMRPGEDDQGFADASLGSGVVVHQDGYVVTNEHVVHGAERLLVKLDDGREIEAETINASTDSDLAIIRMRGTGPFPAAELGDSARLLVGETVIALGNPFGLSSSATTGILSATGRAVRFRGRNVYEDFLQTSALINPGNSGGPLLDINGRVIGINVAIDSRGQGIGFAIPVNRVKEVMSDLVDPAMAAGATLGLTPTVADGRLVAAEVQSGGPAAEQGLAEGDTILAVDDRSVGTPFDFNVALLRRRPNETVSLVVERAGKRQTLAVPFRELSPEHFARAGSTLTTLGMECADITPQLAQRLHLPKDAAGVVVLRVDAQGIAQSLGLRPKDVIVQLGNLQVGDVRAMDIAVSMMKRRGGARIRVWREGDGMLQGTVTF